MKSRMRFLKGAIASISLEAIERHRAAVFATIVELLRAYQRRRRSVLRKRLERAEKARRMPLNTASELAAFALLSAACAVFGAAFMLAIPASRAFDDRVFVLSLSIALFFNFILFLSQFGDHASALSDVDRIGDFECALRDQPSLPSARREAEKYGPANDV